MRPVWPTRVTNRFAAPGGYASRSDAHGPTGHHTGIDFGAAWPIPLEGRLVRAALGGIVTISEFHPIMGNWVGVWDDERDLLVTYWHLQERFPHIGEVVAAGQALGRVGSTGNSTAPHLHVQVNRGRSYDYHGHIDPAVALRVGGQRKVMRAFKKLKARRK